jgi:hypothetical protein
MEQTRRQFLSGVGWTLAAWGVSSLGWPHAYEAVLATPAPRKRALLVGINQYPGRSPLSGCVTDVELQRQLLIHRFGFQISDCVVLTDQQATRSAILDAFTTHLIQSTQPGDVVLVHFSGYGSQLSQQADLAPQPSLVTADEPFTAGEVPQASDLLLETLELLVRSLLSDRVFVVLDTCHRVIDSPLQGNLRPRGLAHATAAQAIAAEQDLLDRLRKEVGNRPDRATWIAAAAPDELAMEARWNGFSAGLLTYALTQSLWQADPTSSLAAQVGRSAAQLGQWMAQQHPKLISPGKSHSSASLATLFLTPTPDSGSDGAIVASEDDGKTLRLWLGGFPAPVLEQYGVGSLLVPTLPGTPPDETKQPLPQLQVLSREGLLAKAKWVLPEGVSAPSLEGLLLQEHVRIVPRNIGLTVALDSRLERIERVDAISALSALPRVTIATNDQSVDCIFGKGLPNDTQVAALPTELPSTVPLATGGYGLFSPNQTTLPNSLGDKGEAVKVAVRRLTLRLQTLQALKLLRLTANAETSQLGIRATLETLAPKPQKILQQVTRLGEAEVPVMEGLPRIPVGSRIQYQIENFGSDPIYTVLLALNSNGSLVTLYIPAAEGSALRSGSTILEIPPGETELLPSAEISFQWLLRNPLGMRETYLICSKAPFTKTTDAIAVQQSAIDAPSLIPLVNPLEVVQSVLQDLHQASAVPGFSSDAYALDVAAWATLGFVYQVA